MIQVLIQTFSIISKLQKRLTDLRIEVKYPRTRFIMHS